MHSALLSVSVDLLIIEVSVVHALPRRELGARWAPNNPDRFLDFDENLGLYPIGLL